MRDALEFEWLGIPSVAVIADALTGPADAMRALSGMAHYPYVVTPFPVGALDGSGVTERARDHVDEVLRLLSRRDAPAASETLGDTPSQTLGDTASQTLGDTADLVFDNDDDAEAAFAARGWTDGLPVALPTPGRVAALLARSHRDRDEVVVSLTTRNGLDATVAQVAVNAVMAGVEPRHFVVVLAALDAMADEQFNLHAHTATMAGAQQVLVVRGPAVTALGFRSEDGALGPGWPSNNRVGRAVRLVIRNLLRSVPGEFDRAGFSHPGRFGWCIGEDPRTPWSLGEPDSSEVLAYATTWQASIINHDQNAEALLDEIGLAVRAACHTNWLHRAVASDSAFYVARPFLFVTGAEHARVLVRGGYRDIALLRNAIFERLTRDDPVLRPVAVASASNIHFLYIHATGMQQTWFFAPFQSHALVRRLLP